MRNLVLAFAILFVVLPFQLSWAQLTETRDLPTFQAVKNMDGMKVILLKGEKESAHIESEKTALKDIITEISGNELQIHFKNKVQMGWKDNYNGNVVITITFKELQAVRNSGSGKITCEDVIRTQNLELKQSGSGHIALKQIDVAQNLEAKVSGSGKLEVTSARIAGITQAEVSGSGKFEVLGGTTAKLEAKISGSGNLLLSELEAENAEAKVSGSGRLRLAVTNHLEAKVSGSGSILYKSKPRSVGADVSGSGRVRAIE